MVAATKSSPVCLGMEIVMSMNIALRACTVALIIVLAADLMPLMIEDSYIESIRTLLLRSLQSIIHISL